MFFKINPGGCVAIGHGLGKRASLTFRMNLKHRDFVISVPISSPGEHVIQTPTREESRSCTRTRWRRQGYCVYVRGLQLVCSVCMRACVYERAVLYACMCVYACVCMWEVHPWCVVCVCVRVYGRELLNVCIRACVYDRAVLNVCMHVCVDMTELFLMWLCMCACVCITELFFVCVYVSVYVWESSP